MSAEETFERDLTDLAVLGREIDAMAARVGGRLRASAYSGRTVTLKLRRYDFTTITRSQTLPQPTDDARQIAATARRLLADAGTAGGLRLLGVGVSGLSVYAQGDLFAEDDDPAEAAGRPAAAAVAGARRGAQPTPAETRWWPGQDVRHEELGHGWVWGRGLGRVTVRFEGPLTAPGPVRTLAADDPALSPADPPDWRPPMRPGGQDRRMTEPSMWTRMTTENPAHSVAYIQRFRDLAAAGPGPGGRGAAGRRDAAPGRAGAGRRIGHRPHRGLPRRRSGTTWSGWTATRCSSRRPRRSTPPRAGWSATWPSWTCPRPGSRSRSTRSSAPAT